MTAVLLPATAMNQGGWRDENISFPLHPKTLSAFFFYLQITFPLPVSSPNSYSISTLLAKPPASTLPFPFLWCLPGIVGDHVVVNGKDRLRIWSDPGNLKNKIVTFKKYLQPAKMWNQKGMYIVQGASCFLIHLGAMWYWLRIPAQPGKKSPPSGPFLATTELFN